MGGKEVEQSTTPQDIIDYLNELCSYALSLGMTYEQYWYDDPTILKHYIKAEEIRLSKRNRELWLQGLYVYHAIGDLVPILNPFSKTPKPRKYFEQPIPITQQEQEEYERIKVERIASKLDRLVGKKLLK